MTRVFAPQARRISAVILGGLQGKATQYAGKKTIQTVCNAYENGFSSVRTGVGVLHAAAQLEEDLIQRIGSPLLQLGSYLLRPVPHPIQQDGLPRRLQFFPHCPSPLPAKSRFRGVRALHARTRSLRSRAFRALRARARPPPHRNSFPILPHSPAGRKPPFTKNLQFNLYKSLDNFHISLYNKLASRKRR